VAMSVKVEFHSGVEDPVAFACRLLRKATRSGARVAVTARGALLGRLDRQLWTFDERDFLPHGRWSGQGPAPGTVRHAPVWLLEAEPRDPVPGLPSIRVNLGAAAPAPCPDLQRLIEIVSCEDEDVQSARGRWKAYRAAGWTIVHHGAAHD